MSENKESFGFYAFDVSPGKQVNPLLADASKELGFGEPVIAAAQIPGEGMRRIEELRRCIAMVFGLSSEKTEEEVAVIKELIGQVPVFVVADTAGPLLRPRAKEIAPHVTAAFAALQNDIPPALTFGYKTVEYVGPPPHWGPKYESVLAGRAKRPSLQKRRGPDGTLAPLRQDDVLWYVEGIKHWPERVTDILRTVRGAAHDLCGDKAVLHYRPHPGEKTAGHPDHLYASELAKREELLRDEWLLHDHLSSEESIGAADGSILVDGATGTIAGAQAQAPVISMFDPTLHTRIGTDDWFVSTGGAAVPAQEVEDLPGAMHRLLDPDARGKLQMRQREFLPAPKPGQRTEIQIVRAIKKYLGR